MLSSNNGCDVLVLGCGITGLTTAIVLQAIGRKVTIITEQQPAQTGESNPLVPTSYAMASAYPHNLRIHNLDRINRDSQIVFRFLHERMNAGIEIYRMFEVFENEPPAAPLADCRMNFLTFDGSAASLKKLDVPLRSRAERAYGWCFDTYFADMPTYLRALHSYFRSKGGNVVTQHIDREDIETFDSDTPLVNCLGLGALSVVTDHNPRILMRGRQILVPSAPVIRDERSVALAYNYTPTPEFFAREDGTAEYVHFFSRSDGWMLGQTREPGYLTGKGEWRGAAVQGDELTFNGVKVPAAILELNKDILKSWKNLNVDERLLVGREGFRFYRDPDDAGVRLQAEASSRGTLLVHNYGHGGSGVTMSWGCALEAARLLSRFDKTAPAQHTARPELLDEVLISLMQD